MKIKFDTFRNIFCNVLIFVLLCSIIFFSLGNEVIFANKQASSSPIYSVDTNSKSVSLMINVYWGTEYIEEMLEILDKYGFKTTFFVGGVWAVKESEMLNRIVQHGHEIGNHAYSHKDMAKMSVEDCKKEISNTNKVVLGISGITPTLFAPPSGSYSKETLKACQDLSMKVILWSKDTVDWRDKNADLIYNRATKNLVGGDLILMHPTKETVKALNRILSTYKENGFIVDTVTNIIRNGNNGKTY